MSEKTEILDLNQWFTPHPLQSHILKSKAKIKLVRCGRRWGKGRCALMWLVQEYLNILGEEGRDKKGLVPNIHIWVLIPTMKIVNDTWSELKTLIPPMLIENIWESEFRITLAGGGVLEVKSADIRATLQATGLDLLWITEADKVAEEIWWDLLPMLTSYGRAGKAYVESFPYTPDSWFNNLVDKAMSKPDDHMEGWSFTSYSNPLIDPKELDWLRDNVYPEHEFNRQFLAQVGAGVSAAFPGWKNQLLPEDFMTPDPNPNDIYRIGVDLGKEQSYTVISPFNLTARRIEEVIRFQTSWQDTREILHMTSSKYFHPPIYIDATGKGEPVVEALKLEYDDLEIYPVTFNAENRYIYLAELALAIEKSKIWYPQHSVLMKELAWMKRLAKMPYDEFKTPNGKTDDCVFSLALAYSKEEMEDFTVMPTESYVYKENLKYRFKK